MEADSALYTCRASNHQDFVDAHALVRVQGNVCTYAYMEHLCFHRKPYSLDCHRDAVGMYHCAPENITDFSCAQN